jgi:hypothetical protein
LNETAIAGFAAAGWLSVLKVTTPFCRFCQLLQYVVVTNNESTHVGRKKNPIYKPTTRSAWAKTIAADDTWKHERAAERLELQGGQSLTGRLWDLLRVLHLASNQASGTDRVPFQVLMNVNGVGRREQVKLHSDFCSDLVCFSPCRPSRKCYSRASVKFAKDHEKQALSSVFSRRWRG